VFNDLLYRTRALFQRQSAEDELDDELRFHLDAQTDKYVRSGLSAFEAERRARIALGGLAQTKEDCRQSWGVTLIETAAKDVAFAARTLTRRPGFSVAVVLSLALGIGANTAIFTLIDAALWRALPVQEPERLFALGWRQGTHEQTGFSYGEYRRLSENTSVGPLAGYSRASFNLEIDGYTEPPINGQLVTGEFFHLLGVVPSVGRAINTEDTTSAARVAMLSEGYWTRRFGNDPSVIGRTIHLLGAPFTVIGVTPRGFFGVEVGAAPDIFVPLTTQPTVMPSFENLLEGPINYRTWVQTITRVEPPMVREQALAALNTVYQRLNDEWPVAEPRELTLLPATALSELRQKFSKPLFVLMLIVGMVLLIACANTANLMLARGATRQSEFSMRLALGASRGRLVRQMLIESLALATLAGIVGTVLAQGTTHLLVKYISTGRTPIVMDLTPNSRILFFTISISALTAIMFGLTPALRAGRTRLTGALHGTVPHRLGPQRALAVVQVALSLMLLIGAGLFIRGFESLNGSESVRRDRVLIARVEPRGSDQRGIPGTSARLDSIYRELIARIEAIPQVSSVSMAQVTPTTPGGSAKVTIITAAGQTARTPVLMAYPRYFATTGIVLIAGRDFDRTDLAWNSSAVCIVNEAFVRAVYPTESPIGKPCMSLKRPNVDDIAGAAFRSTAEPYTIVGVVADSRQMNPRGDIGPLIYIPFLQSPTGRGQMALYVRAEADNSTLAALVREEVKRLDVSLPVLDVRTLEEEMNAALVQQRLIALLTSLFGVLATTLACVGIYGLLSFSVSQRTAEIGLRAALGAPTASVIWLVMRDALMLVSVGVAVGLPAALISGWAVSTQLAELRVPTTLNELTAIAWATGVLVGVTAVAAYLPARRASFIEPMIALRSD